jgi:hypothetical protein
MKHTLILLAAAMILTASCDRNKTNDNAELKYKIDSTINDLIAKHEAANAAKNDSILKDIERMKADSLTQLQQQGPGKKGK